MLEIQKTNSYISGIDYEILFVNAPTPSGQLHIEVNTIENV